MQKSFYTLEVFILPGGGRKAHSYVFSTLEEVKAALEVELSERWELNLWLCYGQSALLSTYLEGKPTNCINLLPYISFLIEEKHLIQLGEDSANNPLIKESESENKETIKIKNALYDLVNEAEEVEFKVFVGWSKVNVPALQEPLVQPGDIVLPVSNYYLKGESGIAIETITDEQLDEFSQLPDEEKIEEGGQNYGWSDVEEATDEDWLREQESDSPYLTRRAPLNRVIFR